MLGLIALLGALGDGLRRRRCGGCCALGGADRTTIAALLATLAGFALAAGIDWMWELTVVAVVALIVPRSADRSRHGPRAPASADAQPPGARHGAGPRLCGPAVVAVAVVAICVEGMLLLSQARLDDSRAAAKRGDIAEAHSAALDATRDPAVGRLSVPAAGAAGGGGGEPARRARGRIRAGDRPRQRATGACGSYRRGSPSRLVSSGRQRRTSHAHATLNPRSPLFSEDVPSDPAIARRAGSLPPSRSLALRSAARCLASRRPPPPLGRHRHLDPGAGFLRLRSTATLALERTQGRRRHAGSGSTWSGTRSRPTSPCGRRFDATDPGDPNYDWEGVDELIRDATARGLQPFISVHDAPHWAERPAGGPHGTNNPASARVAAFFTADRPPLQRHLRGPAARERLRGLERGQRQLLLHAAEGRQRADRSRRTSTARS